MIYNESNAPRGGTQGIKVSCLALAEDDSGGQPKSASRGELFSCSRIERLRHFGLQIATLGDVYRKPRSSLPSLDHGLVGVRLSGPFERDPETSIRGMVIDLELEPDSGSRWLRHLASNW